MYTDAQRQAYARLAEWARSQGHILLAYIYLERSR